MLGMLWNVTSCKRKKKSLEQEQVGRGPRRQGRPVLRAPWHLPVSEPDQSHPTSHSRRHPCCPRPTHCSCLCPSPLQGPSAHPACLCPHYPPTFVSSTPTLPSTRCSDISAGHPLLTPPGPPDSHSPELITITTVHCNYCVLAPRP